MSRGRRAGHNSASSLATRVSSTLRREKRFWVDSTSVQGAFGVEVSAILDHDDSEWQVARTLHPGVFVRSFYFRDPDGILLEFASWTREMGRADDVTISPVNATGTHVAV